MSPNIVGSKRHEARTVALAAALETVCGAERLGSRKDPRYHHPSLQFAMFATRFQLLSPATRKKMCVADSFTKCILDAAKETLSVQMPWKKLAFVWIQNPRTNLYVSAAALVISTRKKRLRRKLRRQLQQDRDNEWTSRARKFGKVWEEKNQRKAYALLKQ